MKRALISVSDKTNIVEFAKGLTLLNYEIISTGGTKNVLDKANIKTISIEDVTNFPEMLDGRVKTLHPKIHGGLLALRDNDDHVKTCAQHDIDFIDLVCVNLYPFKETIQRNPSLEEAIENIDIGGPSMLRSAAKNYQSVTVVTSFEDYDLVLNEIKENGNTSLETRSKLAQKVFALTASYDLMIANYLSKNDNLELNYQKKCSLRYGENPHQEATLYQGEYTSYSVVYAKQIQGKELSYNNINDANATLNILKEFSEPTAVGVKHMNPCGVSSAKDIITAWDNAYNADSVSIFGGIVAFNRPLTKELASNILKKKVFLEIIMAPLIEEDAKPLLLKKPNCRVLEVDMTTKFTDNKMYTSINGGLLEQNIDNKLYDTLEVVTKTNPSLSQLEDLEFAMKVCKHVKSNAIVVASNKTTRGIGAGQMNRVGSAKIALEQANCDNLVLASDAFFPFDDTVKLANKYNVKAIIQPGGSLRDEDSVIACDELNIAMVKSHIRHFKH